MNPAEAARVIRALADGRDPSSGAPLGPESVFERPEVLRALFAAAEALERGANGPSDGPAKVRPETSAGSSWTAEEERKLLERFDAGARPAEIAREHGRTRGAIVSRLKKLGRIESTAEPGVAALPASRRAKPDDGIPF